MDLRMILVGLLQHKNQKTNNVLWNMFACRQFVLSNTAKTVTGIFSSSSVGCMLRNPRYKILLVVGPYKTASADSPISHGEHPTRQHSNLLSPNKKSFFSYRVLLTSSHSSTNLTRLLLKIF